MRAFARRVRDAFFPSREPEPVRYQGERLRSATGEPIQSEDGFLLPHYRGFAAIMNAVSRTYSYRWDEALRHLPENALVMRRDAYIKALMDERQRQVYQLRHHLEPDNPKDPYQKQVAEGLNKIIKAIPGRHHFMRNLTDAMWYGRYANQVQWGSAVLGGERMLGITQHAPVNGDKIQFGFDRTPRIMVNHEMYGVPGANLTHGERGPLLILDKPEWRQRFVIHQHEITDADYYDVLSAGAIGGVGIRTHIYWTWWMRAEMSGWMMNYMQKVGTLGLMLVKYEDGNATQKAQAEKVARDAGTEAAIAVPVPRGDVNATSMIELVPASTQGVQALQSIIGDYFERHMERLIIGQTLSGNAESTGLGSSVANLHADTKFQILQADATNLDDTMTRDLIEVAKRWNYPWADFPVRYVSDVPRPNSDKLVDAAEKMVVMGVALKADEVRGLAGFSKPDPDDEIIGGGNIARQSLHGPGGQFMRQKPIGEDDLGQGEDDPTNDPPKADGSGTWVDKHGQPAVYERRWDEAEHPRDQGGRFVEKGGEGDAGPAPRSESHGAFRNAMAKAIGANASERRGFATRVAAKAAHGMPEQVVDAIGETLQDLHIAEDYAEVARMFWAAEGVPDNGDAEKTRGYSEPSAGRIVMDGMDDEEAAVGTFAHEAAHLIDAKFAKQVGSRTVYWSESSAVWREAWRAEIRNRKEGDLQYARFDPVEGFAEFGRLVWASGADQGEIAKQFPKCLALFERMGLVEGRGS
jgi:hypothetical protein